MNQSDKYILKAFLSSPIPRDFFSTPQMILMVDSIIGLADSAYHGKRISKSYIEQYDLDKETIKTLGTLLNYSQENLQFYYLIKLSIMILYKYAD